jgi:AcrR family transcriptional regulator
MPGARTVIGGLVSDAARDAELAAGFRDQVIGPRLAALVTMVSRAVSREELASDVDAAVLIDALVGPLYLRLLITGEPISDAVADRVVDLVLAGAQRH